MDELSTLFPTSDWVFNSLSCRHSQNPTIYIKKKIRTSYISRAWDLSGDLGGPQWLLWIRIWGILLLRPLCIIFCLLKMVVSLTLLWCLFILHTLILKINHMFLFWFSVAAEGSQAKLEDSKSSIRRNLEFLGPRVEEIYRGPSSEDS